MSFLFALHNRNLKQSAMANPKATSEGPGNGERGASKVARSHSPGLPLSQRLHVAAWYMHGP